MSRYAFAIPLCLALAASAAAQPAPDPGPLPSPLSLDAAIARATDVSHRLAELQARQAAAGAVVNQREAAQNPLVSTEVAYQRTNHVDEFGFPSATGFRVVYPDVPDNVRTRVELRWPIYTGGRLQALERAARAEATATGYDLAAARGDLKLEVARAFWALVTAREAARVVGEAVKRVDAQLADVRSRHDAGFVPPNDVLTVEAQRARQQFLFIEAQNLAASAEADLARLVAAPDGAHLELDAVLEEAGTPVAAMAEAHAPTPEVSPLAAEARQNRKDRAALSSRMESSVERERAAAAGRLPTVSFVSGADYAKPNAKIFPREDIWQPSWDIGVALSWNAWDGGRTRADVAEAKGLTRAIRERLAEFDTFLGLEVRQRTIDLSSARAQLSTARQEVVSATEARRVVQERFAAGVATTTDLLDAQVALLQAELDRTRALASIKLALARLDRAVGR
jgi:outer membrane protein TolC